MLINVPVYTNQNGLHFVNIYVENEDGTFKRTQDEPLRLLRDDISGISSVQGELVSHQYDRQERSWQAPTVSFHYGRPQSFYHFLRDNFAKNKFYVFSKPTLSGRLSKFHLHELQLKTNISRRKLSILKEKYAESTGLWSQQDHAARQQASEQLLQKPQKNDKLAAAHEAVSVVIKNGKEVRMEVLKSTAPKLDIDVEDFRDSNDDNTVFPGQIKQHPYGSAKDKRNSHFLLRFLFDQE